MGDLTIRLVVKAHSMCVRIFPIAVILAADKNDDNRVWLLKG